MTITRERRRSRPPLPQRTSTAAARAPAHARAEAAAHRRARRPPDPRDPCDGRLVRLIARYRQAYDGERRRFARLDRMSPYLYCLSCSAVLRRREPPRIGIAHYPTHDDASCGRWAALIQEPSWP